MTQVAGRAGRGEQAGEVVIQSFATENPGVALAARGDFRAFIEQELISRNTLSYPPFGRIIRVLLKGREEESLLKEAGQAAARLRAVAPPTVDVLGPAPAPLYRVNRWYRAHVLLRGTASATLRNCIVGAGILERRKGGLVVAVDVDPAELL